MKLNLKLPEHILAIAEKENIKLCLPVTNSTQTSYRDHAIPDVVGVRIGYVDKNTDKLVSLIKDDDDGEKLRHYIDSGLVTTKMLTQMTEFNELKHVPHYFIIYDVVESSKFRNTYLECGPGDGIPINGHYACEYEILLGSEEYTRRMIFKTNSVNIPMCEWLESFLEELFDSVEDDEFEDEEMAAQFYKKDSEYDNEEVYCFTMFDEVGMPLEIEFNESEFKSMLLSIRQISCNFVDEK